MKSLVMNFCIGIDYPYVIYKEKIIILPQNAYYLHYKNNMSRQWIFHILTLIQTFTTLFTQKLQFLQHQVICAHTLSESICDL